MGFFELNDINLPTVPWKEYRPTVKLDDNILYTIRSAIDRGNDQNLPRSVGKTASESKTFADSLYEVLDNNGMVVYYPYFKAIKSGTLEVYGDHYTIEAVKEDLWNLVSGSKCDTTCIFDSNGEVTKSSGDLLSQQELDELHKSAQTVMRHFNKELLSGNSVLLEWSFARNSDIHGEATGDTYLVFYELRVL